MRYGGLSVVLLTVAFPACARHQGGDHGAVPDLVRRELQEFSWESSIRKATEFGLGLAPAEEILPEAASVILSAPVGKFRADVRLLLDHADPRARMAGLVLLAARRDGKLEHSLLEVVGRREDEDVLALSLHVVAFYAPISEPVAFYNLILDRYAGGSLPKAAERYALVALSELARDPEVAARVEEAIAGTQSAARGTALFTSLHAPLSLGTVKAVCEVATAGEASSVRAAAVAALRAHYRMTRSIEPIAVFLEAIADPCADVRSTAALAIGDHLRVTRDEVAAAQLHACLRDPAAKVRSACVAALQGQEWAIPGLTHALADKENGVRLTAFVSLAKTVNFPADFLSLMGEAEGDKALPVLDQEIDRLRGFLKEYRPVSVEYKETLRGIDGREAVAADDSAGSRSVQESTSSAVKENAGHD